MCAACQQPGVVKQPGGMKVSGLRGHSISVSRHAAVKVV